MVETKAKETFKIFENGEVIEDKDLISYYKLRLLEIKNRQNLLGQFTAEGKYVFSPEIKKALVKIKKLIVSSDETSFFAQATIGQVVLSFRVNTWTSGNDAIANLYFDEQFNDDRQLNSFIAQYVSENDNGFIGRVKSVFNLVEEIDQLENDNLDVIEQELAKSEQQFKQSSYLYEIEAQYLMLDIIEKLKKGGEEEKKLLEVLLRQYEIEKTKPEKQFVHLRLKHFFEEYLTKENKFVEFFEKNKEIARSARGYVRDIEIFDESAKMKKSEIKTVTASKPSAKKAKAPSYKPPKTNAPYKYKPQKPQKDKAKKKDKPKVFLGFPKKKDDTKAGIKAREILTPAKPKPAPIKPTKNVANALIREAYDQTKKEASLIQDITR